MAGKDLRNAVEHPALLAVDLQFEPVLARKGDLHARKEGREEQHHEDQDNGHGHR